MKKNYTVHDVGVGNKISALRYIIKTNGCNRNELSKATGLSIMTVKKVADRLLEKNIICEKKLESSVGRKPGMLLPSSELGKIICVDLSSPVYCKIKSFNITGYVFKEYEKKFEKDNTYIEVLKDIISEVMEDTPSIIGVGVSVAGGYCEANDSVPNDLVKDYAGIKFKEFFKGAFNSENVIITHDVHMAAYNEAIKREVSSLLYLYFGEGVGSSLIESGKTVFGCSNTAGEIGKFILEDGKIIEEVASVSALRKMYGSSFSELWINYLNEEKKARAIVDKGVEAACKVIYNLIYFANPEDIVIDSNISEFSELIVKEAKKFCKKEIEKRNLTAMFNIEKSLDIESSINGLYNFILEKFIENA